MFHLPTNQRKCLKEEIHKDILVKGEYEVSVVAGQITKLEVTDSKNHILYKKDEATKGKFAFTTDEYDVFQVCFETKVIQGILIIFWCLILSLILIIILYYLDFRGVEGVQKEVSLFMKHGVEAKDYENVSYFRL